MRNVDLYEGRTLYPFRLAAVGGFLFHADGTGGTEHHAAEIEGAGVSELAVGNDNDHSPGNPKHRNHPISEFQERQIPQQLGEEDAVHNLDTAFSERKSGSAWFQ